MVFIFFKAIIDQVYAFNNSISKKQNQTKRRILVTLYIQKQIIHTIVNTEKKAW